jgi:hypothetical protein
MGHSVFHVARASKQEGPLRFRGVAVTPTSEASQAGERRARGHAVRWLGFTRGQVEEAVCLSHEGEYLLAAAERGTTAASLAGSGAFRAGNVDRMDAVMTAIALLSQASRTVYSCEAVTTVGLIEDERAMVYASILRNYAREGGPRSASRRITPGLDDLMFGNPVTPVVLRGRRLWVRTDADLTEPLPSLRHADYVVMALTGASIATTPIVPAAIALGLLSVAAMTGVKFLCENSVLHSAAAKGYIRVRSVSHFLSMTAGPQARASAMRLVTHHNYLGGITLVSETAVAGAGAIYDDSVTCLLPPPVGRVPAIPIALPDLSALWDFEWPQMLMNSDGDVVLSDLTQHRPLMKLQVFGGSFVTWR